ncbi:MAG TPA: hypothetical protein VFT90_12295 [Chryseosolibacter sp.]|nr:hypothetical protein [Chryseosolibacter sp.]
MSSWIDLLEETIGHFEEGAKSVRAYTDNVTYIITQDKAAEEFVVATDEPGFPKRKTKSLHSIFGDVFGIEAKY